MENIGLLLSAFYFFSMKIIPSGILWNLFKSFETPTVNIHNNSHLERTNTYGWTIDVIKIAAALKAI